VSEPVLTRRDLNRALLARQLLLERADLPVGKALEGVAGLQAQDVVAPFIGLWTRLAGFDREQLKRALHRRTAVRATLMRGTIHIVTAGDYAHFAAATLPLIQRQWRSYQRDRAGVPNVEAVTAQALDYASEPRTNAELNELLGDDVWWRVRREALFVNAPGDEPWAFGRSRRFVAATAWLDRAPADTEPALRHLVRHYLAGFGPAGADDVSVWSGLTVAELRPTLEAMRLRRFRDERGRLLFDLPHAPRPDPETPAEPRLLPAFDNTILSHADRTRVLPEQYRRSVIRGGLVDPVVLVDGFVAGRWRLVQGTPELETFAPLERSVRRALRRELKAVAAFAA
jgi:hypothetical protein